MKIKQVAQAVLGLVVSVAASSAMAANGDVTIKLNQSLMNANDWLAAKLGNAVYTNATPVSTVFVPVNAANTTASFIDYAAADGVKISFAPNSLGIRSSVSLLDFTFDIATATISGDVKYGVLNITADEPMLSIGTLTNVGGNLVASDLSMHPSLVALVVDSGLDPNVLPLSSLIQSLTFTGYGFAAPVPEPSTYALMGLGLVGISLVARRRQA